MRTGLRTFCTMVLLGLVSLHGRTALAQVIGPINPPSPDPDPLEGGLTKNGINLLSLNGINPHEHKVVFTSEAGPLTVVPSASGNAWTLKASVAVTNVGSTTAGSVSVAVYLSDDTVLDGADASLGLVRLANPAGTSKLRPGETATLKIKRKVPQSLAAALEGKYLLLVPSAESPKFLLLELVSAQTLSLRAPVTVLQGTIRYDGSARTLLQNLIAVGTNSFQVITAPPYGGTFSVSPGTLSGPKGQMLSILPVESVEVTARPGDVLSVAPGGTIRATSHGEWTTQWGGKLTVAAGAMLSTGEQSQPANKREGQTAVIGPILLP